MNSGRDTDVLIVDGANVVGARPDGWWRDRPGAARRLADALAAWAATEEAPTRIVLVLEGAARAGVPESDGALTVVHAPGEGDDTIVLEAQRAAAAPDGESVVAVTSDRGLKARLSVPVRGAGWLRDALEL